MTAWNGYDFDKESMAVVASDAKGNGAVLWTVGGHLRMEMEEFGLTQLGDLSLDDAPASGIWIWEATCDWAGCSEISSSPLGFLTCEFEGKTYDLCGEHVALLRKTLLNGRPQRPLEKLQAPNYTGER